MGKPAPLNRIRRIPIFAIAVALILLVSALFLWEGISNSKQALPPSVAKVYFQGEYKMEGEEWAPILPGQHISATRGDVLLRGFFQLCNPVTDEPSSPALAGMTVSLYLNHVAATLYLPSGEQIPFETENAYFGEDTCTAAWEYYTVPTPADETAPDIITIRLHNPHHFGNENAVNDFLENLSVAPIAYHENTMLQKGAPERNIGLLIFISALIILGIAAFSSIIHIKYSKTLWLIGFSSLFAGCYFIFGSFSVGLWSHSNIANTRALGLSMMFYILFATALITTLLKDIYKKIAIAVTALSAAVMLCCIGLSVFGSVKFYDTWSYWAAIEVIFLLALILCQIRSLRASAPIEKLQLSIGILASTAFPIDVLATGLGWWQGGYISKFAFLAVFVASFIMVLRVIPNHINAVIKARQLEAEQQALKLELQESRISIMLSQMQPHFIYNTLNTIYHLCEIDPDAARRTISSFSEYLRNNIDTLGEREMISFEKELSFVKTYLDIEKVRFDDELEITFDIGVTGFKLPVLTVQPIVENAVKHGTSKKEGISQLTLSTRETDTCYEITIADTGVGFDPDSYRIDGHKHVGITSVRERLENLCNGTLTIESTRGTGTRATIRIPKKEAPHS